MSSDIGQRLLHIRERRKLSQEEMAARGGVRKRAYCYYESGEREPTREFIKNLAKDRVNPGWLLSGDGPEDLEKDQAMAAVEMLDDVLFGDRSARARRDRNFKDVAAKLREGLVHVAARANELADLVMVPHLGIEAGAGHGRYAVKVDRSGDLAFRIDWMRKIGMSPKNAGLVTVRGDSMLDKLHDGDVVLLDRGDKEIRSGRCYVLRQGDEIIVKYLSRLPNGRIQATSENSAAFPPFLIELGVNIEIIGRVRADTHEWG